MGRTGEARGIGRLSLASASSLGGEAGCGRGRDVAPRGHAGLAGGVHPGGRAQHPGISRAVCLAAFIKHRLCTRCGPSAFMSLLHRPLPPTLLRGTFTVPISQTLGGRPNPPPPDWATLGWGPHGPRSPAPVAEPSVCEVPPARLQRARPWGRGTQPGDGAGGCPGERPPPPCHPSRCSQHPSDAEGLEKGAQFGDKGRGLRANIRGHCRRREPGSRVLEVHKGVGEGPPVGLGCTCHRCPGDGPLPERSAGPLSGAHRMCHTPDGRVLSKSVIGGQSEGMRPARRAGAPSVPPDRGHRAGIERPAGRAQPPPRALIS